jgi:hypothetical protein
MTRFLKLTGRIINTSYITRIQHECIKDSAAYVIYTNGFGWLDNKFTKIEILANENKTDYLKIKKIVDFAIINDVIKAD